MKQPLYSLLPSGEQLPRETFFDLPKSKNKFCFTTCKSKCIPVIEYSRDQLATLEWVTLINIRLSKGNQAKPGGGGSCL